MTEIPLEPRIALIRELAPRGGPGATLAALDAVLIIELALRQLLLRHREKLALSDQREVEQVISQFVKGSRAKGIETFTLGQLVGVIRESKFFDRWSAATGKPLEALHLIDLNALTRFRNEELIHGVTQVSPRTAQFLLNCVDLLVTAFGILSLEELPPAPEAALVANLPQAGESPYRGPLPFAACHRELFFGREAESDALLAQVQTQPFVALVGNSGSGKSSLVAAGLIPRLSRSEWLTLRLQPRNDLFDSLAGALVPHLYPDPAEQASRREPLARRLAEPDYRLDHLLEQLVAGHPKRRVLLAVDQFEEIFTLEPDRPRQRRAVELLLAANRGGEAGAVVLLSLRGDFFGRCLDIEPLRQTLAQWPPFTLGPMDRDAVRAAIICPAERHGLRLEEGLADVIVDELGDEPGHLTLLQTALDELWQRSDHRLLTFQGYHAIGGVAEALARKADELLNGYNEAGRERLRRIFVQLVRPGQGEEDTRQIATEDQVGAENWDLVAQLASARLVVTGRNPAGEETVELAHEALIRHWRQLRDWIAEDRAFRLWQNKLRDSRAEWAGHDRDEAYLLRGARLAEAEGRLAEKGGWLTAEERDYIAAGVALRQREADERERQRRERERLQRRVLYTFAAALMVALGLSAVAGWQWRAAESRKAQAEANFSMAKRAVDELYTEVSESDLLNKPGLTSLRQKLLEKALKFYEEFAEQRTDDPELQAKLAVALGRAGNIRLLLGDNARSEEAYRRSIARFEPLVREHPAVPEYRSDLGTSYNNLGNLQRDTDQPDKAKEAYKKAVEIRKRLVEEHPEELAYWSHLAGSYGNLGNLQSDDPHQRAEAEDAYKKAVKIQEWLVGQHPEVPEYQSNLASSYQNLGVLRDDTGYRAEAAEAYQKAIEMWERLVRKYPQVPEYRSDLAGSYYNLADLQRNDPNQPAEAAEAYQKAIEMWERPVGEYPEVPQYRWKLARSYYNLGNLQSDDQPAEAAEAYQKAIEIRERLVREHPEESKYRNELARSYNNLGYLQSDDQPAEAAEAYQKAIEIRERLVREHPEESKYRNELARSYADLGRLQAGADQPSEAKGTYQKAIEIRKRLVREHPEVPEYRWKLARSYYNLGNLQSDDPNQPAEAAEAYQKAIEMWERLVREHPDMLEYRSDLADGYYNLGYLLQGTGQAAKAGATFQKAIDTVERLVREHPKVPEYRSALATALGALAGTELLNRHPRAAIATAQRALETDPSLVWLRTDLAHGYLLDNQYAKGLALYTENKDVKLPNQKTFAEAVLEDFKEFRAKGLTHPDMTRIERILRGSGPRAANVPSKPR